MKIIVVKFFLQECANLQGSKLGLESRLAEQETNLGQLKQDLLRTTLAKQTLEFEKKELLRRIDELERGCATIKSENAEKDKVIRTHKMQMEEFSRRNKEIALVVNIMFQVPLIESLRIVLYLPLHNIMVPNKQRETDSKFQSESVLKPNKYM